MAKQNMAKQSKTKQGKATQKASAKKTEKGASEKEAPDGTSGGGASSSAKEKPARGAAAPSVSSQTSSQASASPGKSSRWIGGAITFILIAALGAGGFASRDIWWPYAEIYIPRINAGEDARVAVLMERLDKLEEKVLTVESPTPADTMATALIDDAAFQEMEQARAKLSAEISTVIGRLEAVEQTMKAVERIAEAAKSNTVNKGAESVQGLAERIDTLEKSSTLEDVAVRLETLEEQTRVVDNTLSSKAQLLEDVKRRMEGLESRQSSNTNTLSPAASALILTIGQLRDGARQGHAFARELEDVIALAPDDFDVGKSVSALINILQAHAKTGVVTQATLRRSFAEASAAVLQADRQIEGGGWLSAAINRLGSLVTIRRIDPSADADSTDARLARAEADLALGDLAAAVDVLDGLAPPAAEAIAPWLEQARATLAVEQALTALNTIAIAQLSAGQG